MTNKCVVCGQRGKPGGCLSFHRFPENLQRRESWLKALKMENASKWHYVCSQHFKKSDYNIKRSGLKVLKINAVPFSPLATLSPSSSHVLSSFPQSPVLRRQWFSLLGFSEHKILPNSALICMHHFSENDFNIKPSGMKVLKAEALPLPFHPANIASHNTSSDSTDECNKTSKEFDELDNPSRKRGLEGANTNESEKENVVTGERLIKKLKLSESSTIPSFNAAFVQSLYHLSPAVEVHIKSESDEECVPTIESVEEQVLESTVTNEISPAAEIYHNVPATESVQEIVESTDTNEIKPVAEIYISSSDNEENHVPDKETVEYLSDSSTLSALSEDCFASDTDPCAKDPVSVASTSTIVPGTHLEFEEKNPPKSINRKPLPRYFGDCSEDDLNTPGRAQVSWHIINKKILEQTTTIRRLQQQNRRLQSRVEGLNSLLRYLFLNYNFEKKS